MPWSGDKTFKIFYIIFILSMVFMITSIVSIVCIRISLWQIYEYNSYLYIFSTTYGTGFGCVWFRLAHSKKTVVHAIVHTLVLILMLYGHRIPLKLLMYGYFHTAYVSFSMSLFTICVHIIQYILSFHLMVFRYGRTPEEKAFRSGLHAFGGVLTFFSGVMDGYIISHQLQGGTGARYSITLLPCVCILLYGVCTWYLILNPYFDWRRLNNLIRSRPSKPRLSRTPSRSSIRSSSRASRRSTNRSPGRIPIRTSSRTATNKRYDI